ncbi:hypothetical protein ABMA70_05060 [Halobacteriovorax sp. XZX-3]|uniref:hypothetical protein n=1 Tax=unclassified Halobacteriovorax TaxID=2639665 RepID=UPI003718CCE1
MKTNKLEELLQEESIKQDSNELIKYAEQVIRREIGPRDVLAILLRLQIQYK